MVLSNDGSNDVEWSVDEYPSFNVEAVGSQSGTLTPGGRTTLEVRAKSELAAWQERWKGSVVELRLIVVAGSTGGRQWARRQR